jgi:hypothetical protein
MICTENNVWRLEIVHAIGSDFFANIIAFVSLIIAGIAIYIGSRKASEILSEYNAKKLNAIFSYHTNLDIYILRLKRLISDSQGHPLSSLYYFSTDEKIKGKGSKKTSKRLGDFAENFLNYLSSKSEQIPAATTEEEEHEWDIHLIKLTNYLSDFLLYDSNAAIPHLDNNDDIQIYLDNILTILNEISNLIKREKRRFRTEISRNNS